MAATDPPTRKQIAFVHALQDQLRLPTIGLDAHCRRRFGRDFGELTRGQVSQLLEELERWEAIPADVQRAMGQRDLPGFAL